jgi:hypothetical protein
MRHKNSETSSWDFFNFLQYFVYEIFMIGKFSLFEEIRIVVDSSFPPIRSWWMLARDVLLEGWRWNWLQIDNVVRFRWEIVCDRLWALAVRDYIYIFSWLQAGDKIKFVAKKIESR